MSATQPTVTYRYITRQPGVRGGQPIVEGTRRSFRAIPNWDFMHATLPRLEISNFPQLRRNGLETLQVNVDYRCNQTCLHCHVNAGPTRTEEPKS